METKSLTRERALNPSGVSLLILLTIISSAIALYFLPPSSLLPAIATAVASAALGSIAVPILKKIEAGQIIQEDGPSTHLQKAGTPTMGGIFFIPPALMIASICTNFHPQIVAVSLVTLSYGFIGWVDDWQILRQKSNKGLTPRQKLLLQVAFAFLFCLWLYSTQPETITNVSLPFNLVVPLGLFFWLLAGFVMVAETNATNLTDGVDGLAGGTAAIAFLGLGILIAPESQDLMTFCLCLSGGCLGFLVHNRHKASVFMGDTGSLALGGGLAAAGILSQNLWGLLVLSGIFLLESISVIAQVSYYKATKGEDGRGKRLLKMAPIHHHLELSGWSETQIVGTFYLIGAVLAIAAILS